MGVPVDERDAWLDAVLGIDGIPADEPELPRGCVPYLPCAVATLLAVVERADIQCTDVVVDVGSGLGRATAFFHALTGASTIGFEIQPGLARRARDLFAQLNCPSATVIEGDAAEVGRFMALGTVFFLYCPFSGVRLARLLDDLELIASTRRIRVCCVDLPLPELSWLAPIAHPSSDLTIYSNTPRAS